MNLEHAAQVGGYVKLGDLELQCTPLVLEDFAAAQAYLKSKTPDPMEGIADICNAIRDKDVASSLAKEAFNARRSWGSLDTDEGRRWCASADGLSFFLFRQTRKHHPEITQDVLKMKCAELEFSMITEVLERLQEISGGVPENPPKGTTRRPLPKRKKRKRK